MSKMSKAKEYRNKQLKETVDKVTEAATTVDQLRQGFLNMARGLDSFKNQVDAIGQTAKIADWRSLALMKALEKLGITENDITDLAEKIQADSFDQESAKDDVTNNLTPHYGPAEVGHMAIVNLKMFKDGKEVEGSEVFRAKIELGKAEYLQEVDDAIVGLTPYSPTESPDSTKDNSVKFLPLNLGGQTDAVKITLLGLRTRKESTTPDLTQHQVPNEHVDFFGPIDPESEDVPYTKSETTSQ